MRVLIRTGLAHWVIGDRLNRDARCCARDGGTARTLDGESWDNACRWAFKRTYGRKPASDELRDYQRALAERDAKGAADARPIYARLRGEADPAPARAERRRKAPRCPPTSQTPPVCVEGHGPNWDLGVERVLDADGAGDIAVGEPDSVPILEPKSADTPAPEPEKTDTPPAPQAPEPPSPKRRGRPPRVQQARALLQEQLADGHDGPRPGTEIDAAAQAAEIPERSLIAAADALGVRCRRGEWWLPG